MYKLCVVFLKHKDYLKSWGQWHIAPNGKLEPMASRTYSEIKQNGYFKTKTSWTQWPVRRNDELNTIISAQDGMAICTKWRVKARDNLDSRHKNKLITSTIWMKWRVGHSEEFDTMIMWTPGHNDEFNRVRSWTQILFGHLDRGTSWRQWNSEEFDTVKSSTQCLCGHQDTMTSLTQWGVGHKYYLDTMTEGQVGDNEAVRSSTQWGVRHNGYQDTMARNKLNTITILSEIQFGQSIRHRVWTAEEEWELKLSEGTRKRNEWPERTKECWRLESWGG